MSEWKETVRVIYDVCHFRQPTPQAIIAIIEMRHPDYFVDAIPPAPATDDGTSGGKDER